MKTAVFSAKPFEVKFLEKENKGNNHQLLFFAEQLNSNTVEKAHGCEAVSVFSNDDLSSTVLDELTKIGVKFITLRSAGYDHVDMVHAQKLMIKVVNVPEYSPYSIAEHSIMLMMALNRKILLADKRLRQYDFVLDPLIGFDMNGKTVGVIGTGKIGSVALKILHGFGCKILAYDIHENELLKQKFNVSYVTLDELYQQSDIISLYCPLTPQTHSMINEDAINKMKKGVMLINTSRGAIIDTQALFKFLDNKHIGYLGLDVYEYEKGLFFYDHRTKKGSDKMLDKLLTYENVLITGHQAFLTETALQNIAETTLYNLTCLEKGVKCENELH